MKNVTIDFDKSTDECVIRFKLSERLGKSSSGKTTIVATTEGNISLPGHEDIKLGLNVYTK